jgi:hypothetical protein
MPDGFVYEGAWQNGEISGQGTATYVNGDVYEGMFREGKRQGEGTMRYATGQEASGDWQDGALTDNTTPAEEPQTPEETVPASE